MFERLAAIDRNLTERQKIRGGVVGLLAGVALIGLLAFAGVTSTPMLVALSLLGVFTMVVGTLLLGTSDEGEQTV